MAISLTKNAWEKDFIHFNFFNFSFKQSARTTTLYQYKNQNNITKTLFIVWRQYINSAYPIVQESQDFF